MPTLAEQVVIHAPPDAAPKDSKGQSILKPIKRRETVIGRRLILISVAAVLGAIGLALALRFTGGAPLAVRILVAILVAPPLVRFGYAITRDPELEPFMGQDLWNRVLLTSAVLAATWLIYTWVPPYVLDLDYASEMGLLASGIMLVIMLAFGSIAAMTFFEEELFGGLVIAGVYVAATLALAILAGVPLVTV